MTNDAFTHMDTAVLLRVFFECSGLLGTTYAIHHIHYTHQKLNMHIGIANRQHTSRKLDAT